MTEEKWQSVFWTDNLSDHVEMDHERELFGFYGFNELWMMHEQMHIQSDHWDHTHEKGK